jgi:hypothetical protein
MAFDNIDMDSEEDLGLEDVTPPETPSNRPFFVVAGILGAITLLAVGCIAVYALWYLPQQNKKEAAQLEQINAQNTQMAESLIQTQVASAYTETPTPTEVVVEPTATATPVVVEATEVVESSAATQDPRTATVAALLTQRQHQLLWLQQLHCPPPVLPTRSVSQACLVWRLYCWWLFSWRAV